MSIIYLNEIQLILKSTKMKTKIIVAFLLCFQPDSHSQNNISNDTVKQKKAKELNLSFLNGISIAGVKNDLESQMVASGLDQTSDQFFGYGPINHPKTTQLPIFDIEALYHLTKYNGVSINIGLADNVEVTGYNMGYITLKSEIWSVSANYVLNSENKRFNFFFGPSCIIHILKQKEADRISNVDKNVKPGFYIGSSIHIVQQKHWFLAFKTNYRWAQSSVIGPYSTGDGTNFYTKFDQTKIDLSCVDIGISVGIRFGNEVLK
jgi:hypothetical protein